VGSYGLDAFGSGKELVVGLCEHGNESSGSITARNFLTSGVDINFSRTLLHGVS
jgi:hypothetical protein